MASLEQPFDYLLEHVRSDAALPSIEERIRWDLLLDLCLGHPPVRTGRVRDYPYSDLRRASLDLTDSLSDTVVTFRPGRSVSDVSFSTLDYVSALRLVTAISGQNHLTAHQYNSLVFALLSELELTDVVEWAERFGLIHNDLAIAQSGVSREPVRRIIRQARMLASFGALNLGAQSIDSLCDTLSLRFDIHERTLASLIQPTLGIFRIKAAKVQHLIDSTTSVALQRGVSAFSSLALARIRDEMVHGTQFYLHTDYDAASVFLSSGQVTPQIVRAFIEASVEDGEAIRKWLPKLSRYADQAKLEKLRLVAPLPYFTYSGIQLSNLLHTVVPHEISFSEDLAEIEFDRNALKAGDSSNGACTGVINDRAFTSAEYQVPAWYNDDGSTRFGWSATTYSLAGRSERMDLRTSLRKLVREKKGRRLNISDSQVNMVRESGSTRISYLKLDGDSVGALFAKTPFVRQPSLSQRISKQLQDRWMIALLNLVEENLSDVVPIDPIYFGGDDVLVALPSDRVQSFLQSFLNESHTSYSKIELAFSFVNVDLSIDFVHENRVPSIQLIALQCIPRWLKQIKNTRKHGNPLSISLVQKEAYERGYRGSLECDVASFGPHGGLNVKMGN